MLYFIKKIETPCLREDVEMMRELNECDVLTGQNLFYPETKEQKVIVGTLGNDEQVVRIMEKYGFIKDETFWL